jgi:serine/threonine protein kinase
VTEDPRPTQASWKTINDLFHRALEQPPAGRSAWLDEACGGDLALRAEVASLLAAHEQAEDFIESPAVDPAKLVELALEPDQSLVGQTLGQYRITRTLGEGGMGVVYLAEDTRLGRTVALKALAPRFTGDESRRERLRREARAAAALTHPGIATVYALEEFGDHLYIASEYVPGETLREELQRGPLPIARVIGTGLSIARALSAAHDRGVVHRDLKPENVIRSASGQVKILDFGLAFFKNAPQPMTHLTEDGVVLGTPAYMSPEQIKGQPVDFRADLFSLGVMLYELASGVQPFAGATSASTVANILEAQPSRLSELRRTTSDPSEWDALEEIVHICLRKTADARYESTHQLVAALERAAAGTWIGAAPLARTPPGGRSRADDARRLEAASGDNNPTTVQPSWWWQFHQAATSIGYLAMLIPLSFVRTSDADRLGLGLFLLALVASLVSSTLRLHLWFTFRSYPSEWTSQRQRTALWIRTADITFVAVQLIAAALVVATHARVATLLVGAAVAEFLAFAIIEPATTRAAFKD